MSRPTSHLTVKFISTVFILFYYFFRSCLEVPGFWVMLSVIKATPHLLLLLPSSFFFGMSSWVTSLGTPTYFWAAYGLRGRTFLRLPLPWLGVGPVCDSLTVVYTICFPLTIWLSGCIGVQICHLSSGCSELLDTPNDFFNALFTGRIDISQDFASLKHCFQYHAYLCHVHLSLTAALVYLSKDFQGLHCRPLR